MTRGCAQLIGLMAALVLAAAAPAAAGALPEALELRADLFAQEGRDILYMMGHVRLQRGDAVITADSAVVWTSTREAYLEGHVVYRFGQSVVEAEQAYVHWTAPREEGASPGAERTTIDRGFLFHTDVRWRERPDQVSWHLRADEVLQTDLRHFTARRHVTLSPCQYHEPHTYFRASQVELIGEEKVVASDLTYHIGGVWVPPFYWPKLYIPLGWEWPKMTFEAGSSNRFGPFVRTEILYDLPPGTFPLLRTQVGTRLDYFSKRGPAFGLLFRYRSAIPGKEDAVRGELDYYHVPTDHGRDLGKYELGTRNRYRVKFFHSQDMPEGWEFDFEYQRYSDAGFQREYFEREYYEAKPIENRAYVKYTDGPLGLYAHYRWRENRFLDATEYTPQIGANIVSYPIWRNLLYTGHIEFARVRRLLADVRLRPTEVYDEDDDDNEAVERLLDRDFHYYPLRDSEQERRSHGRRFTRIDTSHMLSMPFEAGIFHVEPFVGYRGTYYSRTLDGGSKWRSIFFAGGRVSTQFWRSWDDVRADWLRIGGSRILPLDVNGLRHVVNPELRVMLIPQPSVRATRLLLTDYNDELQPPAEPGFRRGFRRYEPYDPTGLMFGDVDGISQVGVVSLGVRNRWQTRRAGRVVDLVDLDPSLNLFVHDNDDPFNRTRASLRNKFQFRPIEGVLFYADFNFNLSNRDKTRRFHHEDATYRVQGPRGSGFFDYFDTGLSIATSDRWQLTLSQRYDVFDGARLGAQLAYVLSEKWRAILQVESGGGGLFSLRLTRDLHDWIVEFAIESDRETSNKFTGIRLSPKSREQILRGLYYTRDLAGGINAYREERYQQYDY